MGNDSIMPDDSTLSNLLQMILWIKMPVLGVTLMGRVMIGKKFFDIMWLKNFSTGPERLWSSKLMLMSPIMLVLTGGSLKD